MRKGIATRERIVRQAASLFNRKGYAGASVSDVMAATGLRKGGIYRHFDTKEALALEAFDYAVQETGKRLRARLEGRPTAIDRLRAIVEVFCELPDQPSVPGGCPIMNAAIENDDGNERLRERSQGAMSRLLGLVERTIEEGIEAGEIRGGVDAAAVATVTIATVEGALMISRLYGDRRYSADAEAHLNEYFDRELRTEPASTQP